MSSSPQLDAPLDDADPSTRPDVPPTETGVEGELNFPAAKLDVDRTPGRRSWAYRLISFAFLASVAGGLYATRERWQPLVDTWIRPPQNAGPPRTRALPLVSVAEVQAKTIPQYLNGLGTVTAFNSVVVKSRVNGELVEVDIQEGQLVEAGQRLARVDARLFEAIRDQASAQLQRDAAAMELARLNYERIESLFTANSVSQQERDEVEAAFKQAKALVEVDRAALANAELQVSYCDILAPISGRIGLRLLDQGNMIQANDPRGLAVITQMQPISVLFPIPQDEIPRVQKRLKETQAMQVLAFDRSLLIKLAEGTLTALDNQVDPTTGTLRLKAVFENQDEALFPNQFVNVRLLIQPWENALVIPSTAIQRVADELCVYVVQENSKVRLQPVKVAFSEEGQTVVTSGLEIGQKVVTEGTDKIKLNSDGSAEVKLPEDSKR